MGLGAVTVVGVFGTAASFAAVWLVSTTLSGHPQRQVRAPTGPAALALTKFNPSPLGATPQTVAEHWARARALASALASAEPPVTKRQAAIVSHIPLPKPHPAQLEIAQAPVGQAGTKVTTEITTKATTELAAQIEPPAAPKAIPQIAMVTPAPEKRGALPEAQKKPLPASDLDNRTAVYDIAAHTVYLPNGEKLEAHSGYSDKLDDPRYIKVRMRGPTPPNVYDLTMREQLFHGVRAIRLNPVDEGRMYGRDGMLAHTYMLGPNGDSNGCISFKDYRRFLQAFLDGEVKRLVVVPELGDTHWRTAARQGGVGGGPARRYAANDYEPPERGTSNR